MAIYEMTADPAPSASLDPEEKIEQKPTQRPLERSFVFRKHIQSFDRLNHWLLTRCSDEKLKERVSLCGTDAWIDRSPSTGRFRIRSRQCKWRGCPVCRTRWALGIRDKIISCTADVAPGRRKLATLTVRSSSAPLRRQVATLWRSYAKLRGRSLWKNAVAGSIAVLEVTFNERTEKWHPHLHCVLDSAYLDQKKLSKKWCHITLGSKIVDVRAIKSLEKVPTYLAKYLLKVPTLPVGCDVRFEDELYDLWNRMRIARFHGTMRMQPGEEIWMPDYPEDWEPVTTLHCLLQRAAAGEPEAAAILDSLQREPFNPAALPCPP